MSKLFRIEYSYNMATPDVERLFYIVYIIVHPCRGFSVIRIARGCLCPFPVTQQLFQSGGCREMHG